MIKNSAYIRQFTPEQKRQIEAISAEHGIKNANEVLLFALAQYPEIARLKRLIEYKQRKIERLTGENP